MEKNEPELRPFVENFFKNLGAEIVDNEEILEIFNVPKTFEEAIGKRGPYKLRFDAEDEGSEFIARGSTFLKAMMLYLEGRGQTTLIKLKFDRDYRKEFEHYLLLKNSKISSFSRNVKYASFPRFSVTTTLQYLNEKEQILNHLCVENGVVKNFSLEKYEYEEGRKEDLNSSDLKGEYEIAKEELKKIIKNRVEDTAVNLSEKLDKEIERIKKHFGKQRQEFNNNLNKQREQVNTYENQLKKAKPEETGLINAKILRVKDAIAQAEKSSFITDLEKEEAFFINDEKQKHSLRVNNKLINTSIIYYPVFDFEIFLKSNDALRKVNIIYDPMQDVILKEVKCDSCKRDIREIFLCSSSHVSCGNCSERCSVCDTSLCLSCFKKRCDLCGRKLCKKCGVKCVSCLKTICKTHKSKNYADDKDYCYNCLIKCENCGNSTNKGRIKRVNERNICEKCYRLSGLKKG